MKNVVRTLAIFCTLFSLAGCGLKGPLYFPPADKTAPPEARKAQTPTQSTLPTRNDRGTVNNPAQTTH